ncbi:MAG: tetratricopeptide repeat protein [Rhodothermales bacterium]|nr:tetratricopeptide repeat protein [Rhodothermales bacterium]
MGVILELPKRAPEKFGHKRVRKHKQQRDLERAGQMNLFLAEARILSLPSRLSPFEEALLLDDRGNDAAIALYRAAIEAGDYPADSYCNLGILESQAGKIDDAFDCFTKSLGLDPVHFESHYNIGNLFFDVGELRSARVHYQIAKGIQNDFPNLYFNLGLVLALEKSHEEARTVLMKYKRLASEKEAAKADGILEALENALTMSDSS